MTSQQLGEEVNELNLLIKTQNYYISILEELMDFGDHEKIKKLNLLIKLQKEYISNLEKGMDLRDQLIKEYEDRIIEILEKRR